jgi:hypothetical protein
MIDVDLLASYAARAVAVHPQKPQPILILNKAGRFSIVLGRT